MIGVLFVLNAVVLLVLLCRVRRACAVCSAAVSLSSVRRRWEPV